MEYIRNIPGDIFILSDLRKKYNRKRYRGSICIRYPIRTSFEITAFKVHTFCTKTELVL